MVVELFCSYVEPLPISDDDEEEDALEIKSVSGDRGFPLLAHGDRIEEEEVEEDFT